MEMETPSRPVCSKAGLHNSRSPKGQIDQHKFAVGHERRKDFSREGQQWYKFYFTNPESRRNTFF